MEQTPQINLDKLVDDLAPEVQEKLLALLKQEKQYQTTNKIDSYFPDHGPYSREHYAKHIAFIAATKTYKQCAIIAGNQVGKTLLCAYMMTVFLTGLYPDWWPGKRYDGPIRAWAVSISGQKVRDNIQKYLLGPLFDPGTGMIPKHLIKDVKSGSSQVSGLVGDIAVFHHDENGNQDGISWLTFKSYADGRAKFQGEQVDLVWFDEEDQFQQGLYNETKVRGLTTKLLILCSFTPLYGMSDMVLSFIPNLQFPEGGCGQCKDTEGAAYKYVCNVTWDDVPHLTEEAKKEAASDMGEMELLARSRGIPGLGAGLIYPVQLDDICFIPNRYHYEMMRLLPHAYAMDIAYTGGGVTAVLWGCYEEKTDTWYIWDEYKSKGASKADHVAAINARGKWVKGVIDPSSYRGVSTDDSRRIIESYVELGLDVIPAKNTVEAGIQEVYQRMLSGRLKISIKCQELLKELRVYRRDIDYKIVKQNDHLTDDLRYLIMSGQQVLIEDPSLYDHDSEDHRWHTYTSSRDKYTGY